MSLEFNLSSVYLSPRAAKRAHAAGVMALSTNINQMQDIGEFLRRHLRKDVARELPGVYLPMEETTLIIRWGGRIGLSTDVHYFGARPKYPYIRADLFATTQEDHAWFSKADIEADGPMVIEMSINRWDKPQCGARFAESLMGYNHYSRGFFTDVHRFFREPATVDEAIKKQLIADCQAQYPTPVSVLIAGKP